jgi:uncharacterized membrane protein
MLLFNVLLALHVTAGSVSLLAGPVPMLARKGSRLHRRAGDVYAVAMLIAAVAAFVLALLHWNALLLTLAVFTFFMVVSGTRALRLRRGSRPSVADHALCLLTFAFSAWLLWRGVRLGEVTSVFFGLAGGILSLIQWRRLLRAAATNWLVAHLGLMGGAYTATMTAFLVVNIHFLPRAAVFILPTLLGTPLIALAARRYGSKKLAVRPVQSAALPS